MKILHNDDRYLTPELIEKCFVYGKHTKVDKVVTGNGFSTGFLMLKVPVNKINIIIAPNKAVIIDKERSYHEGRLDTENRIGFFYKESSDEIKGNFNVFMFVADSFFLYKKKLWELRYKFNYILIDEAHSIEIQSSFRWQLRDFDYKVEKYLRKINAIVSVTASPNHFTKIDTKIINKKTPNLIINVTSDRQESINRVKKDIRAGEKVVVATNSISVIYNLRGRDRKLTANYIIGTSLYRSCVGSFKMIEDIDSNLTIISSRGFEGYDIMEQNCKVYFFEDRGSQYESFYISNLYQAINRTRKGAKYIEYSVRRLKDKRKQKPSEQEIDKFINNDKLSPENKQTKEYKKFHEFVIFKQDSDGKYTAKKDMVAINLEKEKLLYDKGFEDFEIFIKDRNITINYLEEQQTNIPRTRLPVEIQIENLAANKFIIDKYDLFGDDYYLDTSAEDKFDNYKKKIIKYLIRKVYDNGHRMVRGYSDREITGLNIMSDKKDFDDLASKAIKHHKIESFKKYGPKKGKLRHETFKNNVINIIGSLVLSFINSKVYSNPNWVANRNYNTFVKAGMSVIEMVADRFDVSVTELDISSAFPRIIYAQIGESLPDGFYGENKKNKVKMNVKLNDFFYDDNKKTPKKKQKIDSINSLRDLGMNERAIEWLIDNFFESKYRGDLFNFLSFHEKKIISNIKDELEEGNNKGVIRRHDSVIVIQNENTVSWLNSFEYLDKKGWFKVKNNIDIEMPF